ncbi:MAG: hypothetical protein BGO78_00300 [Chloroflexi bacterium 44-23]|nr:MAG: hypothetical protein BGO78_00300 [Chloroflexi bacterium 44-23]
MHYVFLSPHLDDVALSCGAIVHSLRSQKNIVEVWTIFAGDPPQDRPFPFALSLHKRWQLLSNPIGARRIEDAEAMRILDVRFRHFTLPDSIYRVSENNSPLINKEEDLFQEIMGNQYQIVDQVAQLIETNLPGSAKLIIPLSIGDHIDHRITRAAASKLAFVEKWFFPDFPYVVKNDQDFSDYLPKNVTELSFCLTEKDINTWKKSIVAYHSQISTFWVNEETMIENVDAYVLNGGGKTLWKNDS